MKKIVLTSSVVALAVALGGCSGSPSEPQGNDIKPETASTEAATTPMGNDVKTGDPVTESTNTPSGNEVKTSDPVVNESAPADNSAAPK